MSTLPDRDRQLIWHPYTQMQLAEPPIGIVRGEGVYLFDEAGNRYIDAISSWWVNLHGHAHPYIAEKVGEQLRTLEHVIFAGFTHAPAVTLAERLLPLLPAGQGKVFYSDNGSTAVEVAIKMALQYWGNKDRQRRKIIAFEYSYHGDTFGAMSVSARSSFTEPFRTLLFDVIHIPLPEKGKEEESLQYLGAQLEQHGGDVAAFIFEPLVLGAGGMLMYEAAALDALIARCREEEILIIADEVMTGFGRTGPLFASGSLAGRPDMICLSKGLTGGTMPMGITTCTDDIYNAFLSDDRSRTFFHGHSYTANPIACAAALASLDLLLDASCSDSRARISAAHQAFIRKNEGNPLFTNLRSTGTILALDRASGEQTSYFHSRRDELYRYFIDRQVLLRPLGNTLYLMPPYCVGDGDLAYVYSVIEGLGEK